MITPESAPQRENQDPLSQNLPPFKFGTARFIDDLSQSLVINRSEAERALKVLRCGMAELIVASGHLSLSGVGTFDLRLRREHDQFNPKTHEAMVVPPKVAVHFTPGGKLKSEVFSKLDETEVERERANSRPPFILVGNPNQSLNQTVLKRVEARGEASRQTLLDLMVVKGVVSFAAAQQIFRAFADSLSTQLAELGELPVAASAATGRKQSVRVQDLGTFHLVERAERRWINPATRSQIILAPKRAIGFKVAKSLEQSAQTRLQEMMQRENE